MKAITKFIVIASCLTVLCSAMAAQDQLLLDQVHKSQKLKAAARNANHFTPSPSEAKHQGQQAGVKKSV